MTGCELKCGFSDTGEQAGLVVVDAAGRILGRVQGENLETAAVGLLKSGRVR